MFSCCFQSKSETDILKERVEEMRKQIHNIYIYMNCLKH